MCVMLLVSENGRDDNGEHVATPRYVSAPSAHEVRYSLHAPSSSRPSSGRSRPLTSLEASSVQVRPTVSPAAAQSALSYVETPHDATTTAQSHSTQRETVRNRESMEHSKPSSDTADTSMPSQVVTHHDDMSRVSRSSNLQSSVKAAVTHESARAVTSSQSGNRDKLKTSRLVIITYDLQYL